jgi:hypothetical protein
VARTKPSAKTKLTLRLPSEVVERMERLASVRGITVTEATRQCMASMAMLYELAGAGVLTVRLHDGREFGLLLP